jgi:IPT/TIG domain-containing protein
MHRRLDFRRRVLITAALGTVLAATPGTTAIHADDVTVTSIVPAAGPVSGGGEVTIFGTGFVEPVGVFFGGTRATDVWDLGGSTVVAKAPAAVSPGTVTVTVVTDNGSGILPDGYKFIAPVSFSDDPLAAGTIIQAQHILELRNAIDLARFSASQPAAGWTGTVNAGTPVAAVHMLELRANLEQVLGLMHFPSTTYTDPSIPPASVPVKAVHVQQLRTRLLRTGPACTYTMSGQFFGSTLDGASFSVSVDTGASCDWAVTPDDGSWVTITDGGPRTGSGSFGVTVQPNGTGGPRETLLWVGNQRFSISQGSSP